MTTNKDRAEFEAAIAGKAFGASFERRTDGEYLYSTTEFAWRAWQAARSRSGAVPAGYVLVPVEPTQHMQAAGGLWTRTHEEVEGGVNPTDRSMCAANNAWRAMLAAAPEPPQGNIVSSEEGYRAYSLLARAIDAMEALHSEIEPDEECENGIVPAATMRKFVDAHAELLHERERLAFSSICPDCAAHVAAADAPRSGDAPVAEIVAHGLGDDLSPRITMHFRPLFPDVLPVGTKLYTAPPADARDADTKRLDYIASEYLEITPFEMPTPGGDDADVGWRVYDFHMAPPEKRLVAEVFRDNLREAIDAARSADRAMGGE